MSNKALLQDFARWCRANGFPRPAEEKVIRKLFSAYMDEKFAQEDIIGQLAESEPDVQHGVLQRPISREGHMLVDDGSGAQIEDARHREPDDFDELIAARSHALHRAGGDSLAAEVLLKGENHATVSAAAPFARPNPPTATGALLGGNKTFTCNGFNAGQVVYQDPIQIALWNGDDSEATAVTVSFNTVGNFGSGTGSGGGGRQPAGGGSTGRPGPRPLGIVRFGTRGQQQTVELDIQPGGQITVVASYVQVLATVGGGVQGDTVTITATIGFGANNHAPPSTRTVYYNGLAVNGSFTEQIIIPPFARNLIVTRNGSGVPGTENLTRASAFTIVLLDNYSKVIASYAYQSGIQVIDPILLTGDTYYFTLSNDQTVLHQQTTYSDFSVIFGLGI